MSYQAVLKAKEARTDDADGGNLPVFPFVYSAEDLRTYWSTVNVAIGLLLATAGSFLATILTASDAKIRSGRHYVAWSLVCFTTTLLINLSQQISFATASSGIGKRRERSIADMQVAKSYLQDNLRECFTRFFYHEVNAMQLEARMSREKNEEEREEHAKQRETVAQDRREYDMERRDATERHDAEKTLHHQNPSMQKAECLFQSEEAIMHAGEAWRQNAEEAFQMFEKLCQDSEWISGREKLSIQRERQSRQRERESWQCALASRQRHRESVRRLELVRRSQITDQHELQDFRIQRDRARERREEDAEQNEKTAEPYNTAYMEALRTRRSQLAALPVEDPQKRPPRAFLRYQKMALIQTFAFCTLVAGLALLGATLIKIGLLVEGAFIIVINHCHHLRRRTCPWRGTPFCTSFKYLRGTIPDGLMGCSILNMKC